LSNYSLEISSYTKRKIIYGVGFFARDSSGINKKHDSLAINYCGGSDGSGSTTSVNLALGCKNENNKKITIFSLIFNHDQLFKYSIWMKHDHMFPIKLWYHTGLYLTW